jgi:hypothetical protein
MKKRTILFSLLLFGIGLLLHPSVSAQSDNLYTRRFALVVGANNGGKGRVTLRYAVDDARSFGSVLEQMGGVMPEDLHLLIEPTRAFFLKKMAAFAEEVKRSRGNHRRIEVIFYYSGHSDEENLFFGESRISYAEIKDLITSLKADVRIAILDSCASGALTLPKGVIKRPPFLMDTAYDMKGYAFMTSSSASEAAQESGRLKKSFFTHNLISGMRGAADMNQDGRITLNEAYQFAFDGTLRQTEKTQLGPQHPNYHIEMSGTGDVIITEICNSQGILVLKENICGKIYIHNQDDVLVVELNKSEGREISIGLIKGNYRLINIENRFILESKISLKNGQSVELGRAEFTKTDKISTRSRGNPAQYYPGPDLKTGTDRWQVEIFGGIAAMNPADLNLRATHDDLTQKFYCDDYYSFLYHQGEIFGFSNQNEGGKTKLIKTSVPFGIRLRFSLNRWLDLSFGLTRFSSTKESRFKNSYEIFHNDGHITFATKEFNPYKLSAEGFVPALGFHARKSISPFLRIEAFVCGGPLLAECLYSMNVSSLLWSSGEDFELENPIEGLLEERGKGTGLSLLACIRLDYLNFDPFGIFVEGGYAYQTVWNIAGPGKRAYPSQMEYWEGEWGIKKNVILEPWGTLHFTYPSNGWEGFEYSGWKDRNFNLDCSGLQVRIGITYRF